MEFIGSPSSLIITYPACSFKCLGLGMLTGLQRRSDLGSEVERVLFKTGRLIDKMQAHKLPLLVFIRWRLIIAAFWHKLRQRLMLWGRLLVATQQYTLRDATNLYIYTTLNDGKHRGHCHHPENYFHSDETFSSPSAHSNISNAISSSEQSPGLQYKIDDVPLYFGSTRQRMIEVAPPLGQPAIPMGMPLSIHNLVI